MMTAVHRLPPPFREVILLFYYQNFGISEIADILSLPEGTISSRLSRARAKLKEIFGRRRRRMKQLENLKEIADRNLGGLKADAAPSPADPAAPGTIPKRKPCRWRPILVGSAAAVVLLCAGLFALPRLLSR